LIVRVKSTGRVPSVSMDLRSRSARVKDRFVKRQMELEFVIGVNLQAGQLTRIFDGHPRA